MKKHGTKPLMKLGAGFFLVSWYSIPEYLIVSHRIVVFTTGIARVAFNGVNNAVLDSFDDTDMIGLTVLRARAALIIPVEEDDHAGRGLHRVICPLPTLPEPLDAVDTSGELGNDTGVDIAAFVRTPADEAGAPLHAAAEAVP